ncbi:MAG: branched-chain amino acid ABC transporter substrate-binding protein [Alphaproteobacteria bacterium]
MRKHLLAVAMLGLGLAATPALAEDLTIAVNGPMTGKEATFGAQFKSGAEAAIADINAAGGVLGNKLKLEMGDDACDPKQAVALANKTAGMKPAVVIGHFCSGASIPASSVYSEHGIPMISPASTNPDLTDKRPGPNVFRVCGRDDQQGSVAGAYLAKEFKDKNVAIIHDKTAYGQGLAEETKKSMNAAGKKEVLFEAITPGEKDYTALVTKLKQANVDLLYLGGYHTEGGIIVKQMRKQGLNAILMGGDALVSQEYWQIVGEDGEGTLMTFSPDPRKTPGAAELVKKLRAKGIEPEGYVLYTYAAIQTWKQAAEKAKSVKHDDVVKALKDTKYETVIGTFTFDKKGDPSLPPYAVYKWSKGSYEQL